MVYSRYARREEESIRRALRMLQVNDPIVVQRLIRQSGAGSRLRGFAGASDEISSLKNCHPLAETGYEK
jgi:hypothetical protein